MRTTSLELSKKLYEAFPEWKPTLHWVVKDNGGGDLTKGIIHPSHQEFTEVIKDATETYPAYDTDFLLDKLPKFVGDDKVPHLLCLQPNPVGKGWMAFYRHKSISPSHRLVETSHVAEADTPAEALGNLALALKEAGIL